MINQQIKSWIDRSKVRTKDQELYQHIKSWNHKWSQNFLQVVAEGEIVVELGNWGLGMGWWRLGPFQAEVVDVVGANLTSLDVLKYFFSRK